MSGIATAIVGSAVVGYYSASKSAKAGERGVTRGLEAEERIAEKNLAFQREMAEQQREDFAPWRDVGQQALTRIWEGVQSGAFEVGKINLEDDPGYQVRMQEGISALDASASARGRLLSGAQQKALTRYGQEQGSKEYANAYSRAVGEKTRQFNILSGLSQTGQASAAGQAAASSQLAQEAGGIYSTTAQSQRIGAQNIGAIRGGAYQDYGQIVNQAAQNWLTYRGTGGAGAGTGSAISNNQFVANNANVFGGG